MDWASEFHELGRHVAWVRKWEILDQTDSTNSHAVALLQDRPDTKLPMVVLARRQRRGRGRGSNLWWSDEGSLTFSVACEREAWHRGSAADFPIALGVAVSLCRALEGLLPPEAVGVKWPNDVLLRGRKVAGILVEQLQRPKPNLVIGVGLNVQTQLRHAPPEIRRRATSLHEHVQPPPSLPHVLRVVLEELEQVRQLARDAPAALADQWRRRSVLHGEVVCVRTGSGEVTGRCLGIDDAGALLVQTPRGLVRLVSGEVVCWAPASQR